jgi:hypothetical protein
MSWERIEQPLLVTYFSGVRRGEMPRSGGDTRAGGHGALPLPTRRAARGADPGRAAAPSVRRLTVRVVRRRMMTAAAHSSAPASASASPSSVGTRDGGPTPTDGTPGGGTAAATRRAADVSLPELGSVCVSADLVAVLSIDPSPSTRTVMWSVVVAPSASAPMVHTPPPGSYAPALALELT